MHNWSWTSKTEEDAVLAFYEVQVQVRAMWGEEENEMKTTQMASWRNFQQRIKIEA